MGGALNYHEQPYTTHMSYRIGPHGIPELDNPYLDLVEEQDLARSEERERQRQLEVQQIEIMRYAILMEAEKAF